MIQDRRVCRRATIFRWAPISNSGTPKDRDASVHLPSLVLSMRTSTKAGQSPWIIIAGAVVVDGTEADGGAVHDHHSGDQPVPGAEDSRSFAGRVLRFAGLGKVVPSPRH